MIQCQWQIQIDPVMSIVLSHLHLGPRKYWTPGDEINDIPLCRKVMRILKVDYDIAIADVSRCLESLGWETLIYDGEWIYKGT